MLVAGGNAFFMGSTFVAILLFGNFGVGLNMGVLGGNAVFTFCAIQAQGVAQSANGAGQVLFMGGGTMIVIGTDFLSLSPFFSSRALAISSSGAVSSSSRV